MTNTPWLLLDTETTGSTKPIFTVELAAQRMTGWERDGAPFRRLLNHGREIPPEASRVNGYTREILDRDGDPPADVYRAFAEYVGERPLVSYHLEFDWAQVLVPEWERLGIKPIGEPGFCALKLTQRLLDPVPAGNCKLQTLRQYYRLPERGAHTAPGDVETVIDLFQKVLRSLAERRGLETWQQIRDFTEEEWYASRIPFGKFKGRVFFEATDDPALKDWLEWLADSSNERSSHMGRWYLRQLASRASVEDAAMLDLELLEGSGEVRSGLVIFQQAETSHYRRLVEAAQNRLAELELEYGVEKAKVDTIRSRLFESLRSFYQARDQLKIRIQYQRAYIDRLLAEGEEAAASTAEDFEQESAKKDREYDSTASALEGKRELNEEETSRLKALWKKLVKMFHPDQYEQDPEKRRTYELLTQAINDARDRGDIALLESIAKDPEGFIHRQGWASVTLDGGEGLRDLRSLYEHLQVRILELIEELNDLRSSPDYELYAFAETDATLIERVVSAQRGEFESEISTLQSEADRLAAEIEELVGETPF
jgi:DNA polymerase III epsilon subunit-like protein